MPGMVEAPCVPLFTPPGKSQGTCFGARSQKGSAPPAAVDGAEVCFAPALHALEYSSSILRFCAGGSKCLRTAIGTVNHKHCLEF